MEWNRSWLNFSMNDTLGYFWITRVIFELQGSIHVLILFSDVSIDIPDELDLSSLKATGLQPGEEELPEGAQGAQEPGQSLIRVHWKSVKSCKSWVFAHNFSSTQKSWKCGSLWRNRQEIIVKMVMITSFMSIYIVPELPLGPDCLEKSWNWLGPVPYLAEPHKYRYQILGWSWWPSG